MLYGGQVGRGPSGQLDQKTHLRTTQQIIASYKLKSSLMR